MGSISLPGSRYMYGLRPCERLGDRVFSHSRLGVIGARNAVCGSVIAKDERVNWLYDGFLSVA